MLAFVFAAVRWSKKQDAEAARAARLHPDNPASALVPVVAHTPAKRWPLGRPYDVLACDNESARPAPIVVHRQMEVSGGEIVLRTQAVHPDPAGPRAGVPGHIALSHVGRIDVSDPWFLIHVRSPAGASVIAVQPRGLVDRERLLWELAVRAPAAMEAGLDAAEAA
jgi:hypothetical protein